MHFPRSPADRFPSMSDVVTLTDPRLEPPLGADGVATLSNDEIRQRLDDLFRMRAAVDGRILELLGEVGRREAFRDEGAWDLPHLTGALCDGDITFDKVRTVVDAWPSSAISTPWSRPASPSSLGHVADWSRAMIADIRQASHGPTTATVRIGTT